MRLVTQNIQQGGGPRVARLVQFLVSLEADVLVLTEYRHGKTGDELRKKLASTGYVHLVQPIAERGVNAALLASRLPLKAIEPPARVPESGQRWVSAVVGGIEIAGVYMPATPKELQQFWPPVTDALGPKLGKPFLILGDFNTGPAPADRQGSVPFTGELCMAGLIDTGWVDAWRRANPAVPEFSWFSNVGNGFRIDHGLLSPELASRVKSTRYDHRSREANLSDHSALVLDLGPS
jgi:exodeoxyribonuclease III